MNLASSVASESPKRPLLKVAVSPAEGTFPMPSAAPMPSIKVKREAAAGPAEANSSRTPSVTPDDLPPPSVRSDTVELTPEGAPSVIPPGLTAAQLRQLREACWNGINAPVSCPFDSPLVRPLCIPPSGTLLQDGHRWLAGHWVDKGRNKLGAGPDLARWSSPDWVGHPGRLREIFFPMETLPTALHFHPLAMLPHAARRTLLR